MTDPEWADATYLEPLDAETVAEIVERERPDALLPTLGGQTALNIAVELHEAGVLERFGVELIGASVDAIRRAEDRRAFRDTMLRGRAARARERRRLLGRRARGRSRFPRSFGRRSRSAARAAGSPRPRPSSRRRVERRSRRQPGAARCSSSGRSPAGRSSSSRSCPTRPATASSSARSRTSIRWACTPATRGRSRRSRRFRTPSTSVCVRPRSPARVRSASRPAAPTCSSPTSRRRASSS